MRNLNMDPTQVRGNLNKGDGKWRVTARKVQSCTEGCERGIRKGDWIVKEDDGWQHDNCMTPVLYEHMPQRNGNAHQHDTTHSTHVYTNETHSTTIQFSQPHNPNADRSGPQIPTLDTPDTYLPKGTSGNTKEEGTCDRNELLSAASAGNEAVEKLREKFTEDQMKRIEKSKKEAAKRRAMAKLKGASTKKLARDISEARINNGACSKEIKIGIMLATEEQWKTMEDTVFVGVSDIKVSKGRKDSIMSSRKCAITTAEGGKEVESKAVHGLQQLQCTIDKHSKSNQHRPSDIPAVRSIT
jgi:hypothetical protein